MRPRLTGSQPQGRSQQAAASRLASSPSRFLALRPSSLTGFGLSFPSCRSPSQLMPLAGSALVLATPPLAVPALPAQLFDGSGAQTSSCSPHRGHAQGNGRPHAVRPRAGHTHHQLIKTSPCHISDAGHLQLACVVPAVLMSPCGRFKKVSPLSCAQGTSSRFTVKKSVIPSVKRLQ